MLKKTELTINIYIRMTSDCDILECELATGNNVLNMLLKCMFFAFLGSILLRTFNRPRKFDSKFV